MVAGRPIRGQSAVARFPVFCSAGRLWCLWNLWQIQPKNRSNRYPSVSRYVIRSKFSSSVEATETLDKRSERCNLSPENATGDINTGFDDLRRYYDLAIEEILKILQFQSFYLSVSIRWTKT